jgi:hypothetical protein
MNPSFIVTHSVPIGLAWTTTLHRAGGAAMTDKTPKRPPKKKQPKKPK